MVWATFWAMISQPHLVTLIVRHPVAGAANGAAEMKFNKRVCRRISVKPFRASRLRQTSSDKARLLWRTKNLPFLDRGNKLMTSNK
jgi:hypothetical protein